MGETIQAGTIEFGQRMADIHDHDQASELAAIRQIAADQRLPDMFLRFWRARIAITGQVDQKTAFFDAEEIQVLRATGHFADEASRLWLHSVLIALDLPALERPAKATSARLSDGKFANLRDSNMEGGVEHGRATD
jgi:hypothetical protein